MRLARATSIVGLALAAACSSVSTDDVALTQTATPQAGTTRWAAHGLPIHTRLSATKDSIVYGGVEGNHLYVVALDPDTGEERWRRPSAVSARVQGVEQTILTDDDTAYFLLREPQWNHALVAVTTSTGKERWRHELWAVPVDPSVSSCGDGVCLVVYTRRLEMWKLSKSDGSDVATYYLTSEGDGYGRVLGIEPPDGADATLLVASIAAVRISQFDGLGKVRTWSRPAAELFGSTPVSPNGGWGGLRVDGGWIAWLGTSLEPELDPKAGYVITAGQTRPSGVVAGFDDHGNSRWISANRRPCGDFSSQTTWAFCDGESRITGTRQSELRPNVVEGRNPTTGAVTWKLNLEGEINEANVGSKVLRIDDNRYLIDLSSGPVLLDIERGPGLVPKEPIMGWCNLEIEGDIIREGRDVYYRRASNPFPCRIGGTSADPSLPIPEFAGVNVAGWGAWVEDGLVHAKRQ